MCVQQPLGTCSECRVGYRELSNRGRPAARVGRPESAALQSGCQSAVIQSDSADNAAPAQGTGRLRKHVNLWPDSAHMSAALLAASHAMQAEMMVIAIVPSIVPIGSNCKTVHHRTQRTQASEGLSLHHAPDLVPPQP